MTFINCLVRNGEKFKDVPEFEGLLAISNQGRVYSYPRTVTKFCGLQQKNVVQKYGGRLLSPYLRSGYKTVRFGVDGKKYTRLVSRLVLAAFVAPPQPGQFACHNDSDTENNFLENLRWDDQAGNMIDREARGLYPKGEFHHAAKVPVALVYRLQAKEISATEAAKKYGYRYATLWRIATGKTWKATTRTDPLLGETT